LKKRYVIGSVIAILIMAFFAMSALASANSEVWLSKDSTGYPKATEIQEGDTVWVVVKDSSRGDTDQLDRIYTQILLYDVKTGAYLNWDNDGSTLIDRNFLLETAPNSGLFISNEAFKIGGRNDGGTHSNVWTHTPGDLSGGNWLYYETTPGTPTTITRAAVETAYNPASPTEGDGRVENMDTLMLMYIDPDDSQDISTSLIKIEDTESTVTWPLGNPTNATKPVTVRITDLDENLTCEIEKVPVFFAINPGATVQTNTFCLFNREKVLRWYNIYMAGGTVAATSELLSTSLKNLKALDGVNYGTLPTTLWAGLAVETGVGTGVFEFTIEDLSTGFPTNDGGTATYHSFSTNDVIVAYYLDPNDFDDFQLASCYVDKADINPVWFKGTDSNGEYSLGKDDLQIGVEDLDASTPCCPDTLTVHICDPHGEDDSESLELTEVGVASSQFDGTMELRPVWDALGTTATSGYQLVIDNNKFEAFNEDSIYVRYNGASDHKVSFDLVKVSDTQVFDGDTLNLTFVDASGNPVSFYQSDEIAYIKVVDPDQNENSVRAETIKSYWDKGLNKPFGPGFTTNPYVAATGNWNISAPGAQEVFGSVVANSSPAKIYLWNPTNGEWHAVELLETGVNTGVFMSKAGVPLYQTCVSDCATFAEDKDTVLAFYQDPSNHSDIAIAEIKVDNNASRTTFVDKDGNSVSGYKDTDSAYVLVKDRLHASDTILVDAITIDKTGTKYSLTPFSVTDYTFITGAISLTALGGETITATYIDPDDTDDTSSDSIGVEKTVYPAATATFVNSAGTAVTEYTEGDSAYVKVVDQSHGSDTTLTNALTINQGVGTFTLTKPVGGDNYTFFSGAISLTGLVDVTIIATYTDPADSTRTATDSIPVNSAEFELDSVTVLPNPLVTEVAFSINGGTGFPDTFLVTVYDLAHHEVWRSEQSSVTEITWDGGDLANGPYIYVVVITSSDLQTPYTKKGMVFINR